MSSKPDKQTYEEDTEHNTNKNLGEGRDGEKGKIGYIVLWFLGVPASILVLIFLLRGCS